MSRLAVFVVAYNAESTLLDVLSRIPKDVVARTEEIFVFDDFSTDRTFEVGSGYGGSVAASKTTIRRNEQNLKYGGNQKAGYEYAIERGFDIVVLLHGDGQYAPEVMDRLIAPIEAGNAQMVMGSRMLERGAARRGGMPLYKYLGNRVLTFLQNRLLGKRLSEYHSGYRAYSVAALKSVDLRGLTDSWHFDTQIILEFLRQGHDIVEVPIPTYYGDEICRVNGIPYALRCLQATVAYTINNRMEALRAVRSPSRPAK